MLNRFPFVVKTTKNLNAAIVADERRAIIQYIQTVIIQKKADNVSIKNDVIYFKGTTGSARQSLFGGPDNGTISLSEYGGKLQLCCEIRLHNFFITTGAISAIFGIIGIITGAWYMGIIYFAAFCGLNWLIIITRHGYFSTELAQDIDKMYGYVPPADTGPDKMIGNTKHWM